MSPCNLDSTSHLSGSTGRLCSEHKATLLREILRAPFLGLLFAAAGFAIIFLFAAQCFRVAEVSAEKNVYSLKRSPHCARVLRFKPSLTWGSVLSEWGKDVVGKAPSYELALCRHESASADQPVISPGEIFKYGLT